MNYVWTWGKWPATEWRRGAPWENVRQGEGCRVLAFARASRGSVFGFVEFRRVGSAPKGVGPAGGTTSCLVEFEDGFKMVASRRGLRKVRT